MAKRNGNSPRFWSSNWENKGPSNGAFVLLEIHFKFVLFCFHVDVLFDIVGAFFCVLLAGGGFVEDFFSWEFSYSETGDQDLGFDLFDIILSDGCLRVCGLCCVEC